MNYISSRAAALASLAIAGMGIVWLTSGTAVGQGNVKPPADVRVVNIATQPIPVVQGPSWVQIYQENVTVRNTFESVPPIDVSGFQKIRVMATSDTGGMDGHQISVFMRDGAGGGRLVPTPTNSVQGTLLIDLPSSEVEVWVWKEGGFGDEEVRLSVYGVR